MELLLLEDVKHRMKPPLIGITVQFCTRPTGWGGKLGLSSHKACILNALKEANVVNKSFCRLKLPTRYSVNAVTWLAAKRCQFQVCSRNIQCYANDGKPRTFLPLQRDRVNWHHIIASGMSSANTEQLFRCDSLGYRKSFSMVTLSYCDVSCETVELLQGSRPCWAARRNGQLKKVMLFPSEEYTSKPPLL